MASKVYLDGSSLSPEVLVKLQNFEAQLDLSEEAWANVRKSRQVIDKVNLVYDLFNFS